MPKTKKISFEAVHICPKCNQASQFKNLLVNKCTKVTFSESLENYCKELIDCIECTKLRKLFCNKSPLCPNCYRVISYNLITSAKIN